MRTPPHHDTEHTFEVGGIHNNDYLIRLQFSLLNLDTFQLSLYPLGTASVLPGNLCVSLFAMCELFPDLFLPAGCLLTELFTTATTFPELFSVSYSIPFDGGRSTMRTYFSWCVTENMSISWLTEEEKWSFQPAKLSTSPIYTTKVSIRVSRFCQFHKISNAVSICHEAFIRHQLQLAFCVCRRQ